MEEAQAAIKDLLERDWDYAQGLALFKAYGNNPTLHALLAKDPQSSFFHKKLKQALAQIQITPKTPKAAAPTALRPRLSHWPEALRPVVERRNQAVKERDFLRGTLKQLKTREDRKQVAFRILDLDDAAAEAWRIIDYYTAHHSLPPALEEDEVKKLFQGVSLTQVSKMLNNYRSYRAKARSGQRPESKISFYEAVIVECEKILEEHA